MKKKSQKNSDNFMTLKIDFESQNFVIFENFYSTDQKTFKTFKGAQFAYILYCGSLKTLLLSYPSINHSAFDAMSRSKVPLRFFNQVFIGIYTTHSFIRCTKVNRKSGWQKMKKKFENLKI